MERAEVRRCPALLISAPASGQGKTTVTAALARLHRNRGRRVRVFKTGPDFLDPMILSRAAGCEVEQLDLFMGSPLLCKQQLWEAAGEADLILIEGVMGLFDGNPSSADLAELFGIPVLAVIDAGGMAQTFAALAHGLASFRPGLPFSGVLGNRVGSVGHGQMLAEALPAHLHWYGALPRDEAVSLPSRHLGLVQGDEIADLEQRIETAAQALEQSAGAELPPAIVFEPQPFAAIEPLLQGVRIGIARDAAFSFIYPANLHTLQRLGAELVFFSPLVDARLPEVDALWLPGGYPELHLQTLAANTALMTDVKTHYQAGKPILAECGGMLWLGEELTALDGLSARLCGLLPVRARMQQRFAALGLQRLLLDGQELRGHTFHHSVTETELEPIARGECPNGRRAAEPVYRLDRLTASYIHFYFPSNPAAVAQLFRP
ncbi:cobyrinate a,c-diamide synthase [Marinobacterium sediminicola]|uniref:Cobyrinic acid a,c-diamide synthase n=1 Tax=Marinobacterium sediminicola TaxID=518898 RepID=A0ABY1S1L2_9GAMM|nr:cobyrinate a,c-diamide synthase [Marinobacterium sediminicola]ULG69421.1 cobyrinate a,c-diamide synthase [Marinobacterium sediminicola]SMR75571.1 cobyrinic acid a,c-diamide synthase [Marinobacterium sediminicola]